MVQETRKYAYIDAIRGIAILGVVLVHAAQVVAFPSITGPLPFWGAYGVQLFYVASAVTLCQSWHSRLPYDKKPMTDFFIRRVFRILPLFWLGIVAYLGMYAAGIYHPGQFAPDGIKPWYAVVTALCLHGFYPETLTSVVPGGWSIAVEMTFYLVLPAILLKIKTFRGLFMLLFSSLVLYYLHRLAIKAWVPSSYLSTHDSLVEWFMTHNFIGQMPVFVIGIMAYRVIKEFDKVKRAAAIGLGTFLVVSGIFYWLGFWQKHIVPFSLVLGVIWACFFVYIARYPSRIVVNPVVCYLGKISYGLYITHFSVLYMIIWLGVDNSFIALEKRISFVGSVGFFVFVLLGATAISSLLHVVVESPAIDLGKKIILRREQK